MTAISLSTDPESRDNYGPYVPNIGAVCPTSGNPIRYNNVADLEAVLEAHGKETAAFIVEPIQGEAGVVVPDEDYLSKVSALCKKHNVLFICDEIQTGIGRTGKMLCHQWAGIKPDLVTLGKAISGGMYPVSVSSTVSKRMHFDSSSSKSALYPHPPCCCLPLANLCQLMRQWCPCLGLPNFEHVGSNSSTQCVLADKEVMLVVEPGTHGSTYGGNPLGCAVSLRALELIEEQDMIAKAEKLGNIFRDGVAAFNSPIVEKVRGKGLLNAVVIDESAANGRSAWDLCILLKEKGLLVSSSPIFSDIFSFRVQSAMAREVSRLARPHRFSSCDEALD